MKEIHFKLPRGLEDDQGNLHQNGTMRIATALDEIEPLQDPRVQANEAYLVVLLLSRVVTRLGNLSAVTPQTIERLYASDLAYLQDVYERLNFSENLIVGAVCPNCSTQFQLKVAPLSEEIE